MSAEGESGISELPSVHSCYYGSFFLLRTPVTLHGSSFQIKLDKNRSPTLTLPSRSSKSSLSLKLACVSKLLAGTLRKYGVHHVDTFYYEEVPLFSVVFDGEDSLKRFLCNANSQVRDELRSTFATQIQQKLTRTTFNTRSLPVSLPLDVTVELYHITPDYQHKSAQVKVVNLDSYKTYAEQWRNSVVFSFQSVFRETTVIREKTIPTLKELTNLLQGVDWHQLGVNLEVPYWVLSNIEQTYKNAERCRSEVLQHKLDNDRNVTWNTFAAAVEDQNRNTARMIREKSGEQLPSFVAAECLMSAGPRIPAVSTQYERQIVNIRTVQAKIEHLTEEFYELKTVTKQKLSRKGIDVGRLVDTLTSIPAIKRPDQVHMKVFVKETVKGLNEAETIGEVFMLLNPYWAYYDVQLLEYLINSYTYESVLNDLRSRLAAYKAQLQQFREETPLSLFCEANRPHERLHPPDGFEKMVIRSSFQAQTTTLEKVEEFRKEFANKFNLLDCAMMLQGISLGSVNVTWIVSLSVVHYIQKELLSTEEEFFQKQNIVKLELGNQCIYQNQSLLPLEEVELKPTGYPSLTSASILEAKTSASSKPVLPEPQSTLPTLRDGQSTAEIQSADREYDFVDQPSDDFFCPVTLGLLLEPELTACCGQHLSKAAATTIQKEKGACPLCKDKEFVSVFSKFHRRRVRELQVFCTHKDRGCDWEGELGDLDGHAESCEKKYSPLVPIKEITLQWERKQQAPEKTTRGSFTVNDNVAYITPWNSNEVYSYQLDGDMWDELPPCPHDEPGLAIIKGLLTAVGGKDGSEYTSKLFSWSDGEWKEKFPPMTAKRSRPAVVTTSDGKYVVVAGGWVGGWTLVVELFNTQSSQWSRVCSLPQPLVGADATICDKHIYVQDSGHSVFSCFLQSLVSSSQQDTDDQEGSSKQIWNRIRDIPVESSTLVTLSSQLVAVGGCAENPTANIYRYTSRKKWQIIGEMLTPRYDCLVPVLPGDKMVVMDGWIGVGVSTDAVEVATVL